ncbi:DUF1580 domain-containing protein [Rhodopirellula bahusiensis]|uniref:DUF1580 domain-containing protein n=2 Tax=Rhodopirellula TaxID=265488 RepID=A0A2G1W7Y1_9BACT|nr:MULTISPECIES: DUF1580 domain-containing protein [Rhodopirellula]PHQ35147.1 hypothetical protein CEE69_12065 [Rhodopirellula bahusiensis]WDQ17002.1 DUF1580 domain-containing protein [Rhodopirellula sp. P2]|tara:strand:- start:12029 stop:12310 length:282 start_codon:yes stop_codon:yes gene_type:complete
MAIDVERERSIPLADVASFVPKRNGKKVHYSTIYRWATKGVRGRILESVMAGGIRYTTVEAVHRFLAAKPQARQSQQDDETDAIDEALRRAGV